MRVAALVAIVLALSACSQSTEGKPQEVAGAKSGATQSASAPTTTASPASVLRDRTAWVEQGNKTDLGSYHSASLENGPVTDLKADIAFVSPTGKISCVTGVAYGLQGFNCTVKLRQPLAEPGEGYGNWDGGYVAYSGQRLTVGQFRGDPGLFIHGEGRPLPYDSTVAFGNYTCRMATSGLTCVNATEGSGVQMNDGGIVPLGCLREVSAAEREASVGRAYSC